MDSIVIEGIKPYDGRYEFDLSASEFTVREWGWVKRYSGYMPMTVEDGFKGADPELFGCFALIALLRAGKVDRDDVAEVMDRILDAPFASTIRFESDTPAADVEDDAGPPRSSSRPSTPSSGDDSPTSSVSPAAGHRSAAGTPASATSELAPARSGT